jgi:hypothetical protein
MHSPLPHAPPIIEMTDLYLGLAIMILLGGIMFGVTMLVTRKAPMWLVDGLAGLVVIGIAVYARWIWEETFVGRLLPFSNLIIVSNWFPLAAGMLAGLAWRRIGDKPAKFLGLGRGEYGSTPRKVLVATVLFAAGAFSLVWPILGSPPLCDNQWQGDICLQTTPATCSPAAAATLLQNYGVYASEQEMAELCLTRGGTTWKGLYRGLALKGATVGRRVVVSELTMDDLVENFSEPCILQCELQLGVGGDDLGYQMEGWVPGQPHSLVLLDVQRHSQQGTLFWIADPSSHIEIWSSKDLNRLWQGQTLRLIPARRSVVRSEG